MQNQINMQNLNNISSSAVSPQMNYTDIISQLEQAIATDTLRLQNLLQQGVITKQQGQYLMAQLAKRANEINMCKNSVPFPIQVSQDSQTQASQMTPLESFKQENPDFFNAKSRGAVLDYIKNYNLDKNEISQVAKLVEQLENSAVDSYLKKSAHEKSLNDENSAAKSKLNSYAQNTTGSSNMNRIFTREDIGKMSNDEFTKNEKLIMDQVKQGLIK